MPTDRGLIDQQLQALGERSRWWDQRELRDLPSVLDPDERILAVARGKIARDRWLRRSWLGLRYWLRFLTNPSYQFSLTSEEDLSVLKLECQ